MRTEREIVGILQAKAAALVEGNAAALRRLIHTDFLYVNTRGRRFDREGYITAFGGAGPIRFVAQSFRDIEVRDFGTFTVAAMEVDDRFEIDGSVVAPTARSLCVFARIEGRWLWSAGQTFPVEPTAPG
jgi:hypothetical protein